MTRSHAHAWQTVTVLGQAGTVTRGQVRLGFMHCNGCDRDLPIEGNFYRSKTDGKPQAGCIDCRKRRAREYAAARKTSATRGRITP